MTGVVGKISRSVRCLALIPALFALFLPVMAPAAWSPTDTLLVVNGAVVTAGDLDGLIRDRGTPFGMEGVTSGKVDEVLDKRVGDLLMAQEAMAAGMDERPDIVSLVAQRRRQYAVEAYVDIRFDPHVAVPADSVNAYFERYFWQIQMRRISVRTRGEAERLRALVMAGADMDALARESSLDTKKPTGGLYPLLYWAEVEPRFHHHVFTLQEGEVSRIFPYNDTFTFVRVEQRIDVDEGAWGEFEASIQSVVRDRMQAELWKRFVDEHIDRFEIAEDLGGMAKIIADSSLVIRGEFLRSQPGAVIEIIGGPSVSGSGLRMVIQEAAREDVLQPFAVLLDKARRKATMDLALGEAARGAGFYDHPDVVSRVIRDQEIAVIDAYLADAVASTITVEREEIEDFYQRNKERFRGPVQYRLDILILADQAQAEEAADRLAAGADFALICREYYPGVEPRLGQSNFITAEQLSEPFRIHLEGMQAGESSPAIEMPMGWMVFRLDAIREGKVAPLEMIEMEIRHVVYQLKFNASLEEHLAMLRKKSVIERRQDRIESYILARD